ncbi:MAG TPA: SRPBCC family protein [Candidatus Limnocylindria bacterium]|nr:SRPBCC family protein [Candidatus Limnocylindria bacterium]
MSSSSFAADVDRRAPVIESAEVSVAADRGTVWAVMSDIEAWPSWSKDISSAELLGPLAPGTEFVWQAGPGTIRSRLVAVEPGSRIGWTGSTMGIRAVHQWRIEEQGDRTRVVTDESWSGLLPWLLRAPMRSRLRTSLREGLTYLQAEAERRATLARGSS